MKSHWKKAMLSFSTCAILFPMMIHSEVLLSLIFFSCLFTFRLRYKGYFGGVTALSRDQFFKVNGFSNAYWGWGGEDDDLRIRWGMNKWKHDYILNIAGSTYSFSMRVFVSCRVELQKMKIVRPPADVARYTMVFHKRDSGNEVNRDRSVV